MAKKDILVATRSIRGGTKTGKGVVPHELKAHEELTAERQKALGLDKDTVDGLVSSGALITIPAHVSDAGDAAANSAALKAANERADKAEADLAEAKSTIEKLEGEKNTLTEQLEAATKAAAPK